MQRLQGEGGVGVSGDLTAGLTVAEEYAIWLAHTGVTESAQDDLNEGCDPISERGGEVSDEDWRAGMALAHKIADWVRKNPEAVLAQVRAANSKE
jgi:hypothetical protein